MSTTTLRTYTEEEAAEYLRLKRHNLRDLRQRGGISYHKIVMGRVRYTQQDLDEYLERTRVPATVDPELQGIGTRSLDDMG